MSGLWREQVLAGWGRTSRSTVPVLDPTSRAELINAFNATSHDTLLAHGASRSYGDQALCDHGAVIRTLGLSEIGEIDESGPTITVEAGAPLIALYRHLVPRGFSLPVSPGTGFATIGGAIANDVHGKNHDRVGSFGDHVDSIDLLLADGSVRCISRSSDPELFAATVGGGGLTGIILAATVRLVRIPGDSVRMREQRVGDLDAFYRALEDVHLSQEFSVGWIDALARGSRMGRGIVESADYADERLAVAPRKSLSVPFDFPSISLNRLSVTAFNALYYRRVPRRGRTRTVPIDRFLYPLDAIGHWNRIYGKRGFYQFQCVLPKEHSFDGMRQLLGTISSSGQGSFLAVLKTLGREGPGLLSFPAPGHTLALDFPRRAGVEPLLRRLEEITLQFGGRIYLAKDAWLSADAFQAMYPRLGEFRRVLNRVDPSGRFDSNMARRLRIRSTPANETRLTANQPAVG